MKTYKKILLGTGFSVSILFSGFLFSQKAFAVPVDNADFILGQYFVRSLSGPDDKIDCVTIRINNLDYFFCDRDTTDRGNHLKYYGQGLICNQDNTSTTGIEVTGDPQPVYGGGTRYPA